MPANTRKRAVIRLSLRLSLANAGSTVIPTTHSPSIKEAAAALMFVPLFFAATEKLDVALRGSGGKPRVVIFRMRNVPAMDASGLHAFEVAVEKLRRDRVQIFLTAVQPQPMKVMFESGLAERIGLDGFCADIDQALAIVRRTITPEVAE